MGGSEEDFAQAHSILSSMGRRIIHCGPNGAGLGAKICNNVGLHYSSVAGESLILFIKLMLGVQQIVTAEAMLLGQKLGLDPAVLTSVISSSTGSCWSISINNPVPSSLSTVSPPCERDYEGGFASSLMLKVSHTLRFPTVH